MEMRAGQDHLLEMFDKLHVLNLSSEGADILKSMAESIRSALEKGLLLEQIILNQRNNSLKNQFDIVSNKEKKKKSKSQNSGTISDQENVTNVNQCPSNQNEGLDKSNGPSCVTTNIKMVTNSQNAPTNVICGEFIDNSSISVPTVGKIKPIDQSLLISSTSTAEHSFASSSILNHNSNSHTIGASSKSNPTNPLEQNSCNDNILNSSNKSIESVKENQFPSGPVEGGLLVAKEEPMDTDLNYPNPPVHVASVPNEQQTNNTNIGQTIPPQHYDQPVMPTPFLIKCEPTAETVLPEPEPFIPLQLQCNFTLESGDLESLNNTNASNISSNNSASNAGETSYQPNQRPNHEESANSYQVYIEAGKGATKAEVKGAFENDGLKVISIKVINKQSHSFGFVHFENENSHKKAVNLNNKILIAGKRMIVRPLFKKRDNVNLKGRESNEKKECNKRKLHNGSEPISHNKKFISDRSSQNYDRNNDRTYHRRRTYSEGSMNFRDNHRSPPKSVPPSGKHDHLNNDDTMNRSYENIPFDDNLPSRYEGNGSLYVDDIRENRSNPKSKAPPKKKKYCRKVPPKMKYIQSDCAYRKFLNSCAKPSNRDNR